MSAPPRALFTPAESQCAWEDWRFNCGPGALCLLFGLRPAEVRPYMGEFEKKGYTNPRLMYQVLRNLGKTWTRLRGPGFPRRGGLVRMQWGGPWCNPGRPARAAYRHTHWIASWYDGDQLWFGDVNAIVADIGGWLPCNAWQDILAPWLIQQCEPKGNGKFWPTHILEVTSGDLGARRA